MPLQKVLSIVGHIPKEEEPSADWPEFRQYARRRYPNELDEDLMTLIENLIGGWRKRLGGENSQVGS
jgi:hypothetical protein